MDATLQNKLCKQCGFAFNSDDKRRKFCCLECYRRYQSANQNKGCFQRGNIPWNFETRGVMKANSGTFKKGNKVINKMKIGDVSIRRDKSGKMRAWVKVTSNGSPGDWILRAVHVWQSVNGPVPKGLVIHHKDRDSLNDSIDNLQAMTRAEHIEEHREEFRAKSTSGIAKSPRTGCGRKCFFRKAGEV